MLLRHVNCVTSSVEKENKYLITALTRMVVNYCEKSLKETFFIPESIQSHFMNHQTDTFSVVNQTIGTDR